MIFIQTFSIHRSNADMDCVLAAGAAGRWRHLRARGGNIPCGSLVLLCLHTPAAAPLSAADTAVRTGRRSDCGTACLGVTCPVGAAEVRGEHGSAPYGESETDGR